MFQPAANYHGTITDVISFKAWDRTTLPPWVQVGSDIDGEAADDYSGTSVSLSADGTTVAIGALLNDGNGENSGHVRIYHWKDGSWQQRGADLDGEAKNDTSGTSVSLSADGTTVAIGAFLNDRISGHVRIYHWKDGSWRQRGADLDGEAALDLSGTSVSLSADGTTVAIGAPGNNFFSGHVRIYDWKDGSWQQRGLDLDGEAATDFSGASVSLSADGTTVAIGAFLNDGIEGIDSGHVRIYHWKDGSWQQRGADLDGEAAYDEAGRSVSLSADGTTVAIGATGNNGGTGHVRIYHWKDGSWQQRGVDLDGEAAGDQAGTSVSLSADGATVAIGAPGNNGRSGHVRVYRWNGTSWQPWGADLDGEAIEDVAGTSVSLSADGTTVAIGAPQNAGSNGPGSGHVRVYRLAPSVSTATDTVAVTVTSVNDVPSEVLLSRSSIPENSGPNAVGGVIRATDIDVGDTFTYALVPGAGDTDNANFWISSNDELRTTTGFNYERKASYAIRIRATDAAGAFVERTFVIAVGDVDEAPAIDHLIGPANGVYRAGQPLVFTAVLTQPVTRVGGGPISLPMIVGNTRQEATLVGGLGTNRLTFQYVVKAGLNDADGVSLHRDLWLPKGVFLQDSRGRRMALGVPVLPAGVLVDTAAPVIRSFARPVDGSYRPGDTLWFTAVMSERVTVTGTPAVELTFGTARRLATYVSGSGTSTLTFRYVVQAGDRAPWGIRIAPRLALAGAAITDTAGNAIVPTFSLPSGFRIVVPLGIVLASNGR